MIKRAVFVLTVWLFIALSAGAEVSSSEAMLSDCVVKIRDQIQQYIVTPPLTEKEQRDILPVRARIRMMSSGYIANAKILYSSGRPAVDQAVLAAIWKSQPLPLPDDKSLFPLLREFEVKFSVIPSERHIDALLPF